MGKQITFDAKVERWLKQKKCQTLRSKDGLLLFFKSGFYGALEVKASKNAKKQPLQAEKIKWFNDNSYGRIIYPEIWTEVQKELKELLKGD